MQFAFFYICTYTVLKVARNFLVAMFAPDYFCTNVVIIELIRKKGQTSFMDRPLDFLDVPFFKGSI